MSQESPELVAMRLALGHQLAALREAAGIVQQQVAHKTGYSRSSVAKAEAGRQLLIRQFWQTADELLTADGTLLAHYDQVRAAQQAHEAQCREAELATAYAEAQARAQELRAGARSSSCQNGNGLNGLTVPSGQEVLSRLAGAVGAELAGGLAGPLLYLALLSTPALSVPVEPVERSEQLGAQLRTFLREWAKTMERREHLRLLGWVATAVAASPILVLDPDEQERLSKVMAVPSRVDEQSIDHLETMLRHCKRQEDSLGPQAVLHTAIAQRELLDSLLDECSDELRPRLLSVYSSMSSSIGSYFFNLDDPGSAMHYWDQARAAAQDARNTELSIYALCLMSHFAAQRGKAHAAIDFAAAARNLGATTDDHLLRACTAVEFGIAYAVDGRHKESMAELDRALTGLVFTDRRPPDSPVYWFHEGLVVSHQSDCFLRQGKPAEAAAAAERGLRLFDPSLVRDLAFCTLHLGTARLLSGEVEEAARIVGEGAELAAKNRSARLIKKVHAARGLLQPWQGTSAVQELDDKLVGWGMGWTYP